MEFEIRNHPKFYNVYISGNPENPKLFTKNLIPGISVYGERLIQFRDFEYREWDPYRSKLAALLIKNPIHNFFSKKFNCLYLGASSGTTISHLSDINTEGIIYGVEFAPRSIRQLIQNSEKRNNIIPILGDANLPENYANTIFNKIDLIYQDVAQPNQAEIAIKNSEYYLKKGGIVILAIKSQSIDSVGNLDKIFNQEKQAIGKANMEILESISIQKHAEKHIMLIIKK
ncbi:MAG: fibrillarin-like rRNA/tRNA 2'-O-methyltransferase [Candidatus Lokiarchaeota archaeon]|nr:fibrillarin-like rRNA/tRNA 2'-O-methyltransferase [Candidatus Lokiarchaeota archaeon]